MRQIKKRAAATCTSDRPAKETLHEPKYSIPTEQMQERLASDNGKVLRCINYQRLQFSPVKAIISSLRDFGLPAQEVSKSIGYLSGRGYISVSRNHQAVKIEPDGIRLLAGIIQDSNVTI